MATAEESGWEMAMVKVERMDWAMVTATAGGTASVTVKGGVTGWETVMVAEMAMATANQTVTAKAMRTD